MALAGCAFTQPLTQGERDRAMSELHATRKAFLDSVAGLSKAQWDFKPGPDRWSIAECAEHLALSEDYFFDLVTKQLMASPATPGKRGETKEKDALVLKTIPDRSSKRLAPEALQPTHRWPDPETLLAHFKQSRDRTIAYLQTTQDDLRSRFREHRVVGLIDAYQWFLVAAAHTQRHVAQINEVKAAPDFPKR